MEADARALVLMNKKENILSEELGSYVIEEGIRYISGAFVQDGMVNLMLTTSEDVSDEEFEKLYEDYDYEAFPEDVEIEDMEDEYNPTWKFIFKFSEDHEEVEEMLNEIISIHAFNIK